MTTETSFVDLFRRSASGQAIGMIEIPLIQRDYAQGRPDAETQKIRDAFISVLHRALTEPHQVSLDFVYGDVEDGVFRPLDGQQRLTTLFLLHWFIACRAGVDLATQPWTAFSYATRTSARRFCERLGRAVLPSNEPRPASEWIADQPWFMALWRHDPTIESMLVMIDAIEVQFAECDDFGHLWHRLADEPTIAFHRLAIDDMGRPDAVYIKMNSRGKPLTPFENFKARFEGALKGSPRASTFATRVDREWTNILWHYRGEDDLVDDEFMRYLHFLTEICEWRQGSVVPGGLEERAIEAFATHTAVAEANLNFLFKALDTWVDEDIAAYLATHFTQASPPAGGSDQLVLFGPANLFEDCLGRYGEYAGNRRLFDFGRTLLLYAVLLHRIHGTEDFARRARMIRNLIEASTNEVRLENMPKLVADVERLVREPDLAPALTGATFAKHQRDHEVAKLQTLSSQPTLLDAVSRLEDHPILRGSLNAFVIDSSFPARAEAFERLMLDPSHWKTLTGALLATGDYARQTWERGFQFGSPRQATWWRELLTGQSYEDLARTRGVLTKLLDTIASDSSELVDSLTAIRDDWLERREAASHFDWRYYFVKYDAMRDGTSGIYINASPGMGYDVVMLDKRQLNSLYRDPFLVAMLSGNPAASGIQDAADGPRFTGYVSSERWLTFKSSGLRLRCVPEGFQLQIPEDVAQVVRAQLLPHYAIASDGLLKVRQAEQNDTTIDVEDRVELGRRFIRDAVAAGL